MGYYLGGIIKNDIELLHSKKTNRQYFEEFSEILRKNNIEPERFNDSRAQILLIGNKNNENRIDVYFVGGTEWWEYQ